MRSSLLKTSCGRPWRAVVVGVAIAASLVLPTGGARAATPADDDWSAAIVLDLVGRQATHREVELTTDRLDRGWTRYHLARSLTRGPEWAGGVVDDLYQQILHRGPDAAGRTYWANRLAGGSWARDIASSLFASGEFQRLSGGTSTGYVTAVYDRTLGRAPDAAGLAHWAGRIDAGRPRAEVATYVYTSVESNGRRVDALYQELLDRAPDAGGRRFWAQRLVTTDDLDLAARLVASAEYQRKAAARTDLAPTVTGPGAEWVVSTPGAHGMDADTLAAARDYAFTDGRNTQGVVVVRGGEIVAEWYAPGADADSWAASWSVAKSFTSALVGIAIAEGEIPSVDVPMADYYPEWRGTPRGDITLRHVLWMSSGLDFNEDYAPESFETSDIIQMVVFQLDQLTYAASRPFAVAPGTTFNYSSGDTMLLSGVIQQATGMPLDEYARRKLLDPIAMEKVEWWRDGAGHTLGYCCFDTTSRGYARFGQLYLQGGRWGDTQVVPEAWIEASFTPSPAYEGYGYQWWLDADPGQGMPAVFSARGHDGQYIYVIPELDLVVVRNGTYAKYPGEPVAEPSLFGRYPSDDLVPGQGTKPPTNGWSDEDFLGPIVESVTG